MLLHQHYYVLKSSKGLNMLHKWKVKDIIKCQTEDSLPGLIVKSWWKITGDTLTVLYGLIFHQVSPVTPKQVLPHHVHLQIHLSIPEGEASIILNNWTQIALGEPRKAVGRKASLQTLALLSV